MTESDSEELTEEEFRRNIKEHLKESLEDYDIEDIKQGKRSDLPVGALLTKDGLVQIQEKPSRVRGGDFNVDVIFDARNCVYGRLASHVAKKALEGWSISIVNVDELVINGNPENIVNKFQSRNSIGSDQGPFYPRDTEKIFKKSIKGMLPHKKKRGRKALERVRAFKGNPYDVEGIKIDDAKQEYPPKKRFIKLKEVSKKLGAK